MVQDDPLNEMKARTAELRTLSSRRKAASDRLVVETRQLVEASEDCLARSRATLARLHRLDPGRTAVPPPDA